MRQQRRIIGAIAGLFLAIPPVSGFADPPAHARSNQARHHVTVKHDSAKRRVLLVQTCPPGLASKSPSCTPPGQTMTDDAQLSVGDIIDWNDVHVVTRPGRYGLSIPPDGDRYAVIDGQLVRVSSDSGKVLSILRVVDAILD